MTEHQFGSCESENDFKIIKRKYRSFVVGQKVEKPDLSYAKIIDEADGKFKVIFRRNSRFDFMFI